MNLQFDQLNDNDDQTVSHEAIELQPMAQVQHMPKALDNATEMLLMRVLRGTRVEILILAQPSLTLPHLKVICQMIG